MGKFPVNNKELLFPTIALAIYIDEADNAKKMRKRRVI